MNARDEAVARRVCARTGLGLVIDCGLALLVEPAAGDLAVVVATFTVRDGYVSNIDADPRLEWLIRTGQPHPTELAP